MSGSLFIGTALNFPGPSAACQGAPDAWVRGHARTRAHRRAKRCASGSLSIDEISRATADFYRSDDPAAPGQWLIGDPNAAAS